jgi:hypothetical protein
MEAQMKWRIAAIATAVIPAIAIAQQPTYGRDTARAQARDTARAQVRAEARGAVEPTRPGRRARGRTTWGLSMSQIREFQQALQSINCYDAEIDGIIGPKTRAGIACAMRHHNITGEDPNELTRALGLDFEVNARAGLGSVMRSGARQNQGAMRTDPQPDIIRQDTARDTLQGRQPTTPPTPQNVPPQPTQMPAPQTPAPQTPAPQTPAPQNVPQSAPSPAPQSGPPSTASPAPQSAPPR